MKNLSLILLLFVTFQVSAQTGFGVKAGLTYNADEGLLKTVQNTYEKKGDGSMGYHIGVYKRIALTGLFVQPEIMYVNYKNEFEDAANRSFDVKYKRIDVPVSVGTDVLGLGYIQAGPTFSYYFEDDIDLNNISDLEQDDIALALHISAGVQLQQFSVSARYDFPLGDRESSWVADNDLNFVTESSPKLFHLSLGYRF